MALVALAADLIADASLGALWAGLRGFVAAYVIMPRAVDDLLESLDAAIDALASDRVTSASSVSRRCS